MRDRGYAVAPRSKAQIVQIARTIRNAVKGYVEVRGYLQLDRLLERMPEALDGFQCQILELEEMGADHARTLPGKRLMQIRVDVYEGLCEGRGRDRFTVAHEFGHLFLHSDAAFARTWQSGGKIYCNSEWQADTFASALLIDADLLLQCRSVGEVAERFGVTLDAARVRFK